MSAIYYGNRCIFAFKRCSTASIIENIDWRNDRLLLERRLVEESAIVKKIGR